MLLNFRDNMRGVALGITIVIGVIFALTGTGSLFISTPDSESALVVNGDEISEREVLQAVARERSRILNENPEMDRSLLDCLLYTSPSPRDMRRSRMPSSA